jgi:hypothetical protein
LTTCIGGTGRVEVAGPDVLPPGLAGAVLGELGLPALIPILLL